MRALAVLALGGASAGGLVLILAGVLLSGGNTASIDRAAAGKGDRLAREVQLACGGATMADTTAGCVEFARVTQPEPAFETTARIQGSTTILIRRPVAN